MGCGRGGGYGSWVTVGMVVGWCGVWWFGGIVLVDRDIFEKEI